MKRFCFILVGLLGLASFAAAPASAGKKDDTLVWATDRDNPVADPFYLNTRELVVIGHHIWDTLVIIDPKTSEIKPLLATKWTWVNPTTLEFELRKGVKFHSGKEMDADDVAYTLNHAADKENAIANFALLNWIKSAEAIDPGKVRINLNRSFPPALANLGLEKMREEFLLHPLAIEDAHKGHQRPKIEEYGETLFAVLHTLELVDGEISIGELDIFVGHNFILSVRNRSSHALLGVRDRCEREPVLLSQGAGFVFYALMDAVVDRYFPLIDYIESELEAIEDPDEREQNFQHRVDQMYAHGKALNTASFFEIDDVIDPADTRRWITAILRSSPAPAERVGKKRPNIDTW